MLDFGAWFQTLVDLLITAGDEAATSLLQAAGGSPEATVHLIEDDVTVDEALCYAGVLSELGDEAGAMELITAAVRAAFGAGDDPLMATPLYHFAQTAEPAAA